MGLRDWWLRPDDPVDPAAEPKELAANPEGRIGRRWPPKKHKEILWNENEGNAKMVMVLLLPTLFLWNVDVCKKQGEI